jgi:hypothetical protein
MDTGNAPKKASPKKISLKLKKEYENVAAQSVRRAGARTTLPIAEIKANPVKAIYEYQLEYMFDNTPEELTEVIRRVDEKKGLTGKSGYKPRALRGVQSLENDYDVLN